MRVFKCFLSLVALALIFRVQPITAEDTVRVPPPTPVPADLKAKYEPEFSKKVTFQLEDAPLGDAISFFRQLTKVNIILDPKLNVEDVHVNLKAQDMRLDDAVTWLCKMANAQWELRNDAVYISATKDALELQERREKDEAEQNKRTAEENRREKFRVKLPNGAEVEAEAGLLDDHPGLAEELLERSIDPAQDGVLIYRTAGFPEKIKPESIKERLKLVAPAVGVTHASLDGLLILKGEIPELRRAAALMRALGCFTASADKNAPDEEKEKAEPEKPVEKADAGQAGQPEKPENFKAAQF